jgi:hypothetical protein
MSPQAKTSLIPSRYPTRCGLCNTVQTRRSVETEIADEANANLGGVHPRQHHSFLRISSHSRINHHHGDAERVAHKRLPCRAQRALILQLGEGQVSNGDRFSRISASHSHDGNEKESD